MESSANDLLLLSDIQNDKATAALSQESDFIKNCSKLSFSASSENQGIRQRAAIVNKTNTSASNGEDSRKNDSEMWGNELCVDPDSTSTQPTRMARKGQGCRNCATKPTQNQDDDDDATTCRVLCCCSDTTPTSRQGIQGTTYYCCSDMIDVGLRVIAVIVFCILEVSTPFQRDIHLEELWLYKNPRKPDIVTPQVLLLSVIFCPFILTLAHLYLTKNYRDFRASSWVWTLTLCFNGIVTSLLKVTVGRPRPDFFYRCFPDGNMILANATSDPKAVVTAGIFNCTGDMRAINEGFKSFPSGHSSFAFASYGFISYFLAAKLHTFNAGGRGETWRLTLSLAPLVVAMFVAVSRTCDYHHHWQDVTVGAIIGLVTSYTAYRQYYPSIFSRNCHRALPRYRRADSEFEYVWDRRKHYTPIPTSDNLCENIGCEDEIDKDTAALLKDNTHKLNPEK